MFYIISRFRFEQFVKELKQLGARLLGIQGIRLKIGEHLLHYVLRLFILDAIQNLQIKALSENIIAVTVSFNPLHNWLWQSGMKQCSSGTRAA